MLSLDNAFSRDDIVAFAERVAERLECQSEEIEFSCEPKLDGAAVSLVYEQGVLVSGATRGDGRTGKALPLTCVPCARCRLSSWAKTCLSWSKCAAK
ncbi:hypothetical protein HAALTHF_52530n [Vreelandella aquamarina]|nr:hypothetical protein HAALTHF_52530n [Halomonas axialensis]